MAPSNGLTQKFLGNPRVRSYKPSIFPAASFLDHRVQFTLLDIERMRQDPMVQFGLRMIKGPIYRATWKVNSDNPRVAETVDTTLKKLWLNYLDRFLRCLDYGSAGGEAIYDLEGDQVVLCEVKGYHLNDIRPLVYEGRQAGIAVRGGGEQNVSPVRLFKPRYWWIANEAEFGFWHGKTRLAGAWMPWAEKTNKRGALDCRRMWFLKNAYDGGVMRHPLGTLDLGDGQYRTNQDYARELLEKKETGGVLALPNTKDEQGGYLWEYTPPSVNGNLGDLLQYPKVLDDEILTGLGIPPEVIRASESGSGFAGRAIPAMMFWACEDTIVRNVISCMDEHFCKPLVLVNHGPDQKYTIEPESLMPKDDQGQQQQGGEAGGGPFGNLLSELGGGGPGGEQQQQEGGQ